MKRTEQGIILGIVVVGLLVAFWLLVVSPKQNEASQLQTQIDDLHSSLSQAQQEVSTAQSSRKSFGIDYRRLVVLGKAVPADSDQASLLVQLQDLADRSNVDFRTFDLDTQSSAAQAPPPSSTTTDSGSSDSASSSSAASPSGSSSTSTTAAVPSEAAVSSLPIGASVGPAGLPVMPYTVGFSGGFFQIADFMKRLDDMVGMKGGLVDVKGRLLTVDGFTLTTDTAGDSGGSELSAEMHVTSFLTPPDQGVTGGATPSGPAPATPTPVSSTASSSTTTTTPSTTSTPTATSSTATSTPTSTAP